MKLAASVIATVYATPSFVLAPRHAALNLDQDEEELSAIETAKSLKIENVLKEYELQAAESEADTLEQQEVILDIEMLLDESLALLSELEEEDDASPMAGAFAFSSEGGAFELLEKMDGDELKDFFEMALDEVLLSVEAALQAMSPDAAQGVRTTVRQLKAMKDYNDYIFQRLDESQLASIRYKFINHRLVELQQTFERLDEKRDGAGGGFNERQERVASAKTEVGDDGYDDFGLKKK
ncbi:hypothetical protein BBO99_00006382 [Phytophthora kernoviae]|uniref:Uncharacterized protein n=2 Tax=Phytophthora kernoviae TaxID=325452 RepID=A0A421GKQ1_9STRA|nr:hypothetical protein G195_007278 [Phytophthora kernoviae 00238/432]KAG2516730.1 hypothetical protein JM16_007581 [Phytophthora kernoviae]KAG2519304.1 hypothetical protein JM18_007602 [Phytophthora kernoviae]RLN26546.1 hypothetical protein BBI17_006427 [Phytophthora kernoviae]RLN77902.1 hypothetical protein BBO99_00006382 [Phytophthora kernoviae]